MEQPIWNFEQEPSDKPMDETSYNFRAYLDRIDDAKMQEYRSDWTGEQVMAWDNNFRDDKVLMLFCCERDVDIDEYRETLEECIKYRNRVRSQLMAETKS